MNNPNCCERCAATEGNYAGLCVFSHCPCHTAPITKPTTCPCDLPGCPFTLTTHSYDVCDKHNAMDCMECFYSTSAVATTPEWERWTRVLANSSNPKDKDLLVVKLGILLASATAEARQEEREFVLAWLKQISHDLEEDSFDRIITQFEMLSARRSNGE